MFKIWTHKSLNNQWKLKNVVMYTTIAYSLRMLILYSFKEKTSYYPEIWNFILMTLLCAIFYTSVKSSRREYWNRISPWPSCYAQCINICSFIYNKLDISLRNQTNKMLLSLETKYNRITGDVETKKLRFSYSPLKMLELSADNECPC